MDVDAVIFGGGAAGLWLLDELVRRGASAVLLESGELGRGQTVAAQGIIHGGVKYTLQGLLTGSAAQIREMPLIWRECLAGRRAPDLSGTRIRSEFCYLWRTDSISSRLGMVGARFGLRVAPETVRDDQRPEVLARCPGTVARVDEPVISTPDLLRSLSRRHSSRLLKVEDEAYVLETESPGRIAAVHLFGPDASRLTLHPRWVIFTAGAGNAGLRERSRLSARAMQRRPLHMVMLRGGRLPYLNGHCVDGAKTRVTVTSDTDSGGRVIWQVGGQVAEDGVGIEPAALIQRARAELESVIPGLDLSEVEWGTYRVDRAEGATASGSRPENCQVILEGNTITAWPTKLALVPQLVEEIVSVLTEMPLPERAAPVHRPVDWTRPVVAQPPWETCRNWWRLDAGKVAQSTERQAA